MCPPLLPRIVMSISLKLDSYVEGEKSIFLLTIKFCFSASRFWNGRNYWNKEWKADLCTLRNKYLCKLAHSRLLNGNLRSRRDKDMLLAVRPFAFYTSTFRCFWYIMIFLINIMNYTIRLWNNELLLLKVSIPHGITALACQNINNSFFMKL